MIAGGAWCAVAACRVTRMMHNAPTSHRSERATQGRSGAHGRAKTATIPQSAKRWGGRTWGRSPGCWVQMPVPSAFPPACGQWQNDGWLPSYSGASAPALHRFPAIQPACAGESVPHGVTRKYTKTYDTARRREMSSGSVFPEPLQAPSCISIPVNCSGRSIRMKMHSKKAMTAMPACSKLSFRLK
jgi:hypothetical protein